jgi:hypothetical protein
MTVLLLSSMIVVRWLVLIRGGCGRWVVCLEFYVVVVEFDDLLCQFRLLVAFSFDELSPGGFGVVVEFAIRVANKANSLGFLGLGLFRRTVFADILADFLVGNEQTPTGFFGTVV